MMKPTDILHTAEDAARDPFMRAAIAQARRGIRRGDGGPFGCVVVRDGRIVGKGHNRVVSRNDPTCHGEIDALRDAGANIGSFDLTGCTVYTTGEPCQMCLTACLWARVDHVVYGCTIADNAAIGFRDEAFDRLFEGREKLTGFLEERDRAACLALFDEYKSRKSTSY